MEEKNCWDWMHFMARALARRCSRTQTTIAATVERKKTAQKTLEKKNSQQHIWAVHLNVIATEMGSTIILGFSVSFGDSWHDKKCFGPFIPFVFPCDIIFDECIFSPYPHVCRPIYRSDTELRASNCTNPYTLTFPNVFAMTNEECGTVCMVWVYPSERNEQRKIEEEAEKKKHLIAKECEHSTQVTAVYIQFIGCVH